MINTYFLLVCLSLCLAQKTIETHLRAGESVEYELIQVPETDECYQFTWIGTSKEDNLSNNTESFPTCLDLGKPSILENRKYLDIAS